MNTLARKFLLLDQKEIQKKEHSDRLTAFIWVSRAEPAEPSRPAPQLSETLTQYTNLIVPNSSQSLQTFPPSLPLG